MGWIALGVIFLPLSAYGALSLWRRYHVQPRSSIGAYPEIELTKELSWVLLNLAVINDSQSEVWAEECHLVISDCDGAPSLGYQATYRAVLPIREMSKAGETLRMGLAQAVYEAAGRPQDDYSLVLSGKLKCRVGHAWHSPSFRRRRVMMRGPYPLGMQEMRETPQAKLDDREASLHEIVNR